MKKVPLILATLASITYLLIVYLYGMFYVMRMMGLTPLQNRVLVWLFVLLPVVCWLFLIAGIPERFKTTFLVLNMAVSLFSIAWLVGLISNMLRYGFLP
jgi:hypothetical protein